MITEYEKRLGQNPQELKALREILRVIYEEILEH